MPVRAAGGEGVGGDSQGACDYRERDARDNDTQVRADGAMCVSATVLLASLICPCMLKLAIADTVRSAGDELVPLRCVYAVCCMQRD